MGALLGIVALAAVAVLWRRRQAHQSGGGQRPVQSPSAASNGSGAGAASGAGAMMKSSSDGVAGQQHDTPPSRAAGARRGGDTVLELDELELGPQLASAAPFGGGDTDEGGTTLVDETTSGGDALLPPGWTAYFTEGTCAQQARFRICWTVSVGVLTLAERTTRDAPHATTTMPPATRFSGSRRRPRPMAKTRQPRPWLGAAEPRQRNCKRVG